MICILETTSVLFVVTTCGARTSTSRPRRRYWELDVVQRSFAAVTYCTWVVSRTGWRDLTTVLYVEPLFLPRRAEAAQPGAGITHNEAEATPEAVVPERLRTEDSAPTPTSSASQRRPQEYSVLENAFIPEDWAAFPISAGSDSNTRNIRLSPESSGTITIRRRENGRNERMDLFQITSSQ